MSLPPTLLPEETNPTPPTLPDEDAPKSSEGRSYQTFAHHALAQRFKTAIETGKFGSAPAESNPAHFSLFVLIFTTLPKTILFLQLVWSSIVVVISYFLAPDNVTSLSIEYWSSRLVVSSSVAYAVGWALFVLLGFFIQEASNRYYHAQLAWAQMTAYLRSVVRDLRQAFPAASWHPGDLERIVAHLIACPIVIKMQLRGEREYDQLEGILCHADIEDVLEAPKMGLHCTRIVRGYFSAAQDDASISFQSVSMEKTPAGRSTQHLIMDNVDSIDAVAGAVATISAFRPSAGYVNHLKIFLYIWMFFLPLAVVQTSGWFTILWSVLITYGIAMLFTIAQALNDPFGYDVQDIKLNRLAADTGLQLLNAFSVDKVTYTSVIDPDHDTPSWLEQTCPKSINAESKKKHQSSLTQRIASLLRYVRVSKYVAISLAVLLLWTAFIIFLTWGITRNDENSSCRWWCIYIPVGGSTDAYVSLGLFLVLGFWLNDAYSRFSRGLELWQSKLKPAIEEAAFRSAMSCSPDTWHHRDRERLLSYFAALPFAAKQVLRDSKDTTELDSILSTKDVAAFKEADNMFEHAMDVIYSYSNSLDCGDDETCKLSAAPTRGTAQTVAYTLRQIAVSVQECMAIQTFPISSSFTKHLQVFAYFWLALLPLVLVEFNGFLVFLYITPIGFSVANLLKIGNDLADPFGCDEYDISLETFCEEIKISIQEIYENSQQGTVGFVHGSTYVRDSFEPCESETRKEPKEEEPNLQKGWSLRTWFKSRQMDKTPSPLTSVFHLFECIPSVSVRHAILIVLWTIVAVFTSYGLSFSWNREKRNECQGWCSPVDVDLGVLGNVGFALFMILAFRASDAIGRYENGARIIFDLKMQLRTLAIEVCQNFRDGMFHDKDKERIVAHIVQIPLTFRDHLLSEGAELAKAFEGLLSTADRRKLESNNEPISYLLQTIEAYIVLQDKKVRNGHHDMEPFHCPKVMVIQMLNRMLTLRELIQRAFGIKRFPVVKSYTKHQHLFTVIWLVLLPFAMTPATGFFTLLWAPIISYGVIGLEDIAVKLVDPYGTDAIDLPVSDMCVEAAGFILEAVHNTDWDCEQHIGPSAPKSKAVMGVTLQNQSVRKQYALPRLEPYSSAAFGEEAVLHFDKLEDSWVKPRLYSHLLHSVPWRVLILISCYTTLAVALSYVSRDRLAEAKWWLSRISIDTSVATYVSFAAFLLLGFYVHAAFDRYKDAGNVWADMLHSSCHSLAVQFLTLFDHGAVHEGDHNRVIAHIAALPLVLKSEMRNSRDSREIKGLLSQEDLANIHCAGSMSRYCVEVIKAYFHAATSRPECAAENITIGPRFVAMTRELNLLEKAVQQSEFLATFPIAPGFLILLNALLAIWFLILPFALAEISGWFTILWVSVIACGVLGMYTIASEIQHPFGYDLNDLDLDSFARNIVADILFIRKYYRSGGRGLNHPSQVHPFWKTPIAEQKAEAQKRGVCARVLEKFRLAGNVFSPLIMALVLVWTAAFITFAWLVSENFPFDGEFDEACAPWFCSRIAIDSSVQEYIGFALFLLLGFRIFDSHSRFVKAVVLWQGGIIAKAGVASNRIFESYRNGLWHAEDLDRIAAHLAAFPVAVIGRLRGEDYKEKFEEMLGEEDVRHLLSTSERANYCLDVVQNYLADGDRISQTKEVVYPAGAQEVEYMWMYLQILKASAFECDRMVRVPLPYGYVQHLRIFLVIWLALLPLGLVETSGWLTILWIVFVTYGVVGIEKWASELADPFGHDVSDVPLDEFAGAAIGAVRANLESHRNGLKDIVEKERTGLEGPKTE